MARFVDTEDLWWSEKSNETDFDIRVLGPSGKSWSEVRPYLESNSIIEGKIGCSRYCLHIPASALELAVDVSRITPENHRDFAA